MSLKFFPGQKLITAGIVFGGIVIIACFWLFSSNSSPEDFAKPRASQSTGAPPPQPTPAASESHQMPRAAYQPESWTWRPQSDAAPFPTQTVRRLGSIEILQVEAGSTRDGRKARRSLLETNGKYSPIILHQEVLTPPGRDPVVAREIAFPAGYILIGGTSGTSSNLAEAVAAQLGTPQRILNRENGTTLVKLQAAEIDSVDRVISGHTPGNSELIIEPDYLLFTSEQLDSTNELLWIEEAGRFFDEQAQDWVDLHGAPPSSLTRSLVAEAAPAGTERLITFDPPYVTAGSYRPEVRIQNFVVSTGAGLSSPFSSVYIQNAYNSGYPENGSNYLRCLGSDTSIKLRHKEGLPFTLHAADLSEYSTVYASPRSVTFRGTTALGNTINHTVVTDGVIDGRGAATDFQTFTLPASFTDLTEIEVTGPPFMVDNLVVTLEGQETPPEPLPAPPVLYEVTWESAPHVPGEMTAVGGPYAPTSISFGRPFVREGFSVLPGRSMELTGEGTESLTFPYGQVKFDMARSAKAYEVEFDVCQTQNDTLAFFADLVNGLVRLDIQNQIPENRVTHVLFHFNVETGIYRCEIDGVERFSGAKSPADIRTIRFSLNDRNRDGGTAIDNVVIRGFGIEPPTDEPRISTTPESSLVFSPTILGQTANLILRVTNIGSQPLELNSASIAGEGFTLPDFLPTIIPPSQTAEVPIVFQPETVNAFQAELSLFTNDARTPVKTITLTGSGLGIPRAVITPALLDVAIVEGDSGTEEFVVSNTGSDRLEWQLVEAVVEGRETPEPVATDDPLRASLWGITQTEADRAWTYSRANKDILVAVIDTGIDLDHPDLASNLITNSSEIPWNGIDDDGNGYVDDFAGWDFSSNDNDPDDGHGHGTHVAGTIAALGNNAIGVIGVAHDGGVLPVQFLSSGGSGYTSDAIESIQYAMLRGARIINASWGGGGYSHLLENAIAQFCSTNDGFFVSAAGNQGSNADLSPSYPAAYATDGIISVAATTASDNLAYFSNYGAQSVDIAAPGYQILSCFPGANYVSMSGTSMAAPHMSGAVALALSMNDNLRASDIPRLFYSLVDQPVSLNGKLASNGRLNILPVMERIPPPWISPQPASGAIAAGGSNSVSLQIDARTLSPKLYATELVFATNDPSNPAISLAVNVEVFGATTYHQWLTNEFGESNLLYSAAFNSAWSMTADPDDDGLANIFEFLFGSNPSQGDAPAGLAALGTAGNFQLTTAPDTSGVDYWVEWSKTLKDGDWHDDQVSLTPAGIDPDTGLMLWDLTFDPAFDAGDQLFLRLQARESAAN